MKKSYLFIMCGIPGSGKSYFANSIARTNSVIVSRDEVRFSIISDEDEYFSKENLVFREFVKRIQEGLDNNKVVYADATHLNGVSRFKLLNSLDVTNTDVIPVYMKTPLSVCLERNAKREGRRRVPDTVIKNMYNSMTDPANDEEALGEKIYSDILYVDGDLK